MPETVLKELKLRVKHASNGDWFLCEMAAEEIEQLQDISADLLAALEAMMTRGAVLSVLEDDEREAYQALVAKAKGIKE